MATNWTGDEETDEKDRNDQEEEVVWVKMPDGSLKPEIRKKGKCLFIAVGLFLGASAFVYGGANLAIKLIV